MLISGSPTCDLLGIFGELGPLFFIASLILPHTMNQYSRFRHIPSIPNSLLATASYC
jgi:hypothetical protein